MNPTFGATRFEIHECFGDVHAGVPLLRAPVNFTAQSEHIGMYSHLRRDVLNLLIRFKPVAKLKPTVGGLKVQFVWSGEVAHGSEGYQSRLIPKQPIVSRGFSPSWSSTPLPNTNRRSPPREGSFRRAILRGRKRAACRCR